MDLQIQDPLMVKILELCKDGASKSKIVNGNFSRAVEKVISRVSR
jgi:hypothetical protein